MNGTIVHYDPESDLRDIKSKKNKNGSSRDIALPASNDRCVFDFDIPMSKLRGLTHEQVYDLMQGPVTDCLMKAYLGVSQIDVPRGFECEIGGGASDKGWGIEGRCRLRF
jgi:hypothetical protein